MTMPLDCTQSEKLRRFLVSYAGDHDGETPLVSTMHNELGIPVYKISLMLLALENQGLVHIISWKPLRIMVTEPRTKLAPGEAADGGHRLVQGREAARHRPGRLALQRASKGLPPEFNASNREMERNRIVINNPKRKPPLVLPRDIKIEKLGTFIVDFTNKSGMRPSFRNAQTALGYSGSSAIRSVYDVLVEKGWAEPLGRMSKLGLELTDKGRARFGPQVPLNLVEPGPQPGPEPTLAGAASVAAVAPVAAKVPSTLDELLAQQNRPGLIDFSDMDLIIELNDRGYLVRRA